jgi:hypothetical protein
MGTTLVKFQFLVPAPATIDTGINKTDASEIWALGNLIIVCFDNDTSNPKR